MRKFFCDICEDEIIKGNEAREGKLSVTKILRGDHVFTVEVSTSFEGVADNGHFCRYCIIDVVKGLDDRHQTFAPTMRG